MKIAVIHATAGAGHMKAAEAVYKGLKKYTSHDVHFVDALDLTNPLFKKLYRGTYTILVTHFKWVWGAVFGMLDFRCLQGFVRGFRRIYNTINCSGVSKFLKEGEFDYIVSSHFMPNEIAAALKRKGEISSTIISIVTDYDVHHIWLANGVDHYVVATEWTMAKIVSLGVNVNQVSVTGIPTDEEFSKAHDRIELKKKLGLKPDVFTALIATGSFGIGPIEEIIQSLTGVQVVVICGHNKGLYERLSKYKSEFIYIFGLVNNMPEMMGISDVMITKPGGLSISEALVSGLPLIFFSAIPGQETNNIKVLHEYDVGQSDLTIPQIGQAIQGLNISRDHYITVQKRTKALAKPSAVKDIIKLIK